MSEPAVEATGVLLTTYHCFMVAEDDGAPGGRPSPPGDGLVQNYGDLLMVRTGTSYGPVNVTVKALTEAAGPAGLDGWDDASEVSVRFDQGHARVRAFEDEGPEDFPDVTTTGPGW